MQTTALSFTKTSYSRTQAMFLASDIAERIRANDSNAASYVGTTASASATPGCIGGTACSGAALAASDMTDWSNRILEEYPGTAGSQGVGYIFAQGTTPTQACPSGATVTPIATGFMRVLITWSERNSGTATRNLGGGESAGDCYQFDFAF